VLFRFDPANVRRVLINESYEFGTTDESQLIIETPGEGWSVSRRFWTKTVCVRRTRNSSHGVIRQVAHASHGSVYQAGGDMVIGAGRLRTPDQARRVKILLPAGVPRPEVASL
jgi:hypothetical protein